MKLTADFFGPYRGIVAHAFVTPTPGIRLRVFVYSKYVDDQLGEVPGSNGLAILDEVAGDVLLDCYENNIDLRSDQIPTPAALAAFEDIVAGMDIEELHELITDSTYTRYEDLGWLSDFE